MKNIEKFYKDKLLQKIPKKLNLKIEVFKKTSKLFEKGKEYTELEINNILKTTFKDFALLRRYLVDFNILKRAKDGSSYSLKEEV